MARVIFVCDGCGCQEDGGFNRMGAAFKPGQWYQRSDDDGTQLACSRSCLKIVSEKSGKTSVVLPV